MVDKMTVASVMTTNVVTALPDTPFRELVLAMADNEVSALPVIDGDGRPIGVVSEADLLAKQEFRGGQDELPHGDRAGRDRWYRALGHNAAEVMTTPVRAVHADEPVSDAARQLAKAGIRRLFVTDRDGRLIGVVSRRDLLGVYLCGDEELRARTAELLLLAGIAPGAVDVRVDAGVVTVDGEVVRPGLADAAVRLVRALPGVVGVRDNVRRPVGEAVWTGFKP
ncbi:MAG: CBS domain-containing protein [Actinophytocola sp.]|uniref:CBS domain-containing protein n=1 Tax=Actinophytocola sp. TaxID=1872138 RepID=UPI0013285064|nr:CBS domain-containing protein [Actinophytocola sp.]MPZ78962.1 CBS domain-containing protein [Actinophytocola sp.]